MTELSLTRPREHARSVPEAGTRLAPRPRRGRRLGPGRAVPGALLVGPVLLLIAWILGSGTGLLDPNTLSPPWTVVTTFGDLVADGRLQSNLLTSVRRAGIALVIGIGLGVVLALVSGLSRTGEALIDGPVQIKRAIPTLALIPLAIIWFGIGEDMKIIVIAASVFVPVYINTHAALSGVDGRYVELAETVGLSRRAFVRRVALPGALPGFFTGLRLAVTISWLALVVVEQVNATSGIGYLMTQARNYGQTEVIVVGLVVYAVFGLVGDTVVRQIERRALSWRRTLGS
ncbi:MAG: alkanesulfonate transporter subunit [Pseudonocardia sp.]|jgi:sulfonate transport system permease protein|uniref:ABC transporter permease n=1 Tax=Pseudonocardia sp. TaxID=60912 RepID=UPI002626D2A9|nr:ABC transporter permease [Pseudonocardia sp.]MCU1626643.1 alkanesulfonate transporter subunit [Pseudonocardia sp.]MDT7700054.1 sulfonate transport system permease protein [Pseudonocardiales bacterium]